METDAELEGAIGTLDTVLKRLENRLSLLRAVLPVAEAELVADARAAVAEVDTIRAAVHGLAREAKADQPRWATREQLLEVVKALTESVSRIRGLEGRASRLRAMAEAIQAGRVANRSPRVRATFEELRLEACKELLEAAAEAGGPALPGPDDFGAWLAWAIDNAETLTTAGLPGTADFSEILPDGFVRSPEAQETDSSEISEARTSEDRISDVGALNEIQVTSEGARSSAVEEAAEVARHESIEGTSELVEAAEVEVNTPDAGASGSPVPMKEPPTEELPAELKVAPAPEQAPSAPAAATSEEADAGQRAEKPEEVKGKDESAPLSQKTAPQEVDLAISLRTFEAFEQNFWISPEEKCEAAPWLTAGFAEALRTRCAAALGEDPPNLRDAWVMASAAKDIAVPDVPDPEQIELFAEVWNRPRTGSAALARLPVTDLSQAVTDEAIAQGPRWRLRVLGEALNPRPESQAAWVVPQLIEASGFRNQPLRNALSFLLSAPNNEDPVACLRRAAGSGAVPAETAEDLAEKLSSARSELHRFMLEYRPAGGARIKTKHCRDAWARFVERILPELRTLYPKAKGGTEKWDARSMSAFIESLPAVHDMIADAANAQFEDRRVMDRAVLRLREFSSAVNEIYGRIEDKRQTDGRSRHGAASDDSLRVMLAGPVPEGDEGFAIRILRRVASAPPDAHTGHAPLSIDIEAIRECPSLLRALRRGPTSGQGDDETVPARSVEAPLVAASALLFGRRKSDARRRETLEDLRDALEGSRSTLLQLRVPHLVAEEQRKDRERAWLNQVEERIARGERTWVALAAVGLPAKSQLRGALDDARARALEKGLRPLDPHLFLEWLDQTLTASNSILDETKNALRAEAQKCEGDVRHAVDAALSTGRLGDAVRLLSGDGRPTAELPQGRESVWRADAARQFSEPVKDLKSLQATNPALGTLLSRWLSGVQAKEHLDKQLREEFDRVILRTVGVQSRSQVGSLRVPATTLREWFREHQHNPACLPQLARLSAVVLATPQVSVRDRSFVQKATQLVTQLCAGGESLVGILAPRLEPEVRREMLSECRKRNLLAGVVDDLDLCRILNAGGTAINPVLALLEILLEQQPLASVSPFLVPEGQNVQMEMYFGRKREARELVVSARYSRLFSGRKLGKSALLKYVEATYDGKKLPSQNVLRVLYVSAVGVDSESGLVEGIRGGLSATLRWKDTSTATEGAGDAPGRLANMLRNYLRQHERDNLLIVLDEADVFIEHQLASYRTDFEKCLSFRMRSQMEAETDAQGLPRVRFVFAGYRVANTTEGAWANWGDVLRLAPLEPEDAAALIVRPLGRIGIDAAAQSRVIAHRCGYQPAVLLRFGERLVKHLDRNARFLDRTRTTIVVGEDDVVLTMEDPAVQEEIRTVVQNNFQGNRVSSVVFAALLREFLAFAPGHAISNPEEVVLGRLSAYSDGDLAWLAGQPLGADAEVTRILLDLVERKLLAERRDGSGRRRALLMMFPHHLAVMEPLAREEWIRSEIEALLREEPAKGEATEMPGLFSYGQLRVLENRSTDLEEDLRAVGIIGSHWQEAVTHATVGLPDRLGIGSDHVVIAGDAGASDLATRSTKRLLVAGARPADVERLSGSVSSKRQAPLFCGGIELLRWGYEKGVSLVPEGAGDPALVYLVEGLGRLKKQSVAWWFERVLGLNFPVVSAIEEIVARTGGIPVLVREMDRALVGADGRGRGENLSAERWDLALEVFEASLKDVASRLIRGGAEDRLGEREVELLRMAVTVRRVGPMGPLGDDMSEGTWEVLYGGQLPVRPLSQEDGNALRVLLASGLLPFAGEMVGNPLAALVHLPEDDALLRLVDSFEG